MKLSTYSLALVLGLTVARAIPANAQDFEAGDPTFDQLPPPNEAVEDQLEGEFAPLDRPPAIPLGALQKAWDKAQPGAGVYRVRWNQNDTIRISVREAMTTTIRLPDWEVIDSTVLGDQKIFRSQQLNDNTLELWTTIPGSDTSLKILGESGNIYSFYIRAETWNSDNLPDLAVIVEASGPALIAAAPTRGAQLATYPLPNLVDTLGGGADSEPPPAPDWLKRLGFDPTRIRRDLTLQGDEALAPYDVFRDDQFTFLCYGDNWEDSDLMVAAPYQVVDGVDRQVNFRVTHNCLIVETVGDLTLKHGDSVLCVRLAAPLTPRKPKHVSVTQPPQGVAPDVQQPATKKPATTTSRAAPPAPPRPQGSHE